MSRPSQIPAQAPPGPTTMDIWDATSGQRSLTLRSQAGWVDHVIFGPDLGQLATINRVKDGAERLEKGHPGVGHDDRPGDRVHERRSQQQISRSAATVGLFHTLSRDERSQGPEVARRDLAGVGWPALRDRWQ